MSKQTDAQTNSTARVADVVPWRVVKVLPLAGHRLAVRFADGTNGEVDVGPLVFGEAAGVFTRLRDADLFGQVFVDHGAVAWPGDLDLAPDAMYDAIKRDGTWTPG